MLDAVLRPERAAQFENLRKLFGTLLEQFRPFQLLAVADRVTNGNRGLIGQRLDKFLGLPAESISVALVNVNNACQLSTVLDGRGNRGERTRWLCFQRRGSVVTNHNQRFSFDGGYFNRSQRVKILTTAESLFDGG